MGGIQKCLNVEFGVELWSNTLRSGGQVASVAYYIKSLRTPEVQYFPNLNEAETAFSQEVDKSKSSDFVKQRLKS